MKVVNDQVALLSNYEVMKLLQNRADKRGNASALPQNVATVEFETLRYLQSTPVAKAQYTDETVSQFLERFKDVKMTKGEKLMILNHRPSDEADLLTMIDEIGERFPDGQHEELLKQIDQILPAMPEEEQEDDT